MRIFCALALLLLAGWCSTPAADSSNADGLSVTDARLRLPLPGQSVSVLYFTVENLMSTTGVIKGVRVEGAERAELHRHFHEAGMMKMRQVMQVSVAAKERLEFRPHGYHVMVFGLSEVKEAVTVTLKMADGSEKSVSARLMRL